METKNNKIFGKDNLQWMLIGLVVIAIGLVLMAGGKGEDPNVFAENEVYSMKRITLAPLMIVAGLLIEVYAIMRKSKA
jgi:membrane protein CcdC involved in cytochrome C biogenesis